MTTVSNVIAFLEHVAPVELSEDWDNVGLLVGHRGATVERLLTCLTLTPDVAAEAVRRDAQLIVSHHPVLFRAAKRITDDSVEGRMILSLVENGIAVFSPHTCFDSSAEGINQQLAESFGLTGIQPIRPHESLDDLGGGRVGKLTTGVKLDRFLGNVRTAVAGEYLEFSGSINAPVSHVAVACGAASEFLRDAIRLGCDTFVTGESRFHSALEARAAGVNLILLGHYSSERPAVERLAVMLATKFPKLTVCSSLVECDPLKVFIL